MEYYKQKILKHRRQCQKQKREIDVQRKRTLNKTPLDMHGYKC